MLPLLSVLHLCRSAAIADIDEAVLKRALTVLQKRGMARRPAAASHWHCSVCGLCVVPRSCRESAKAARTVTHDAVCPPLRATRATVRVLRTDCRICSWQATIIEPDEDDDEDDMTGVKFHAESFVK